MQRFMTVIWVGLVLFALYLFLNRPIDKPNYRQTYPFQGTITYKGAYYAHSATQDYTEVYFIIVNTETGNEIVEIPSFYWLSLEEETAFEYIPARFKR